MSLAKRLKPLNTLSKAVALHCKVDGCNETKATASRWIKGMCNTHYLRLTRHGRANSIRRKKGTGTIKDNGYIGLKGNKYKHIEIVEKVLGKDLPNKAEVHHVDGNRANNTNSNLVVCTDREYHMMLHRRQKSIEAGYPANYRKCNKCSDYDSPDNMNEFKNHNSNGFRYQHPVKESICVVSD